MGVSSKSAFNKDHSGVKLLKERKNGGEGRAGGGYRMGEAILSAYAGMLLASSCPFCLLEGCRQAAGLSLFSDKKGGLEGLCKSLGFSPLVVPRSLRCQIPF